jgi:hypothetical protein
MRYTIGTDMDEVHSTSAREIILFYQDTEGYLCYQCAIYWASHTIVY